MHSGYDLSTLIQLEPELIQEYYDHYNMSQYAQPMMTLIELAKANPDSKQLISIKNLLQNADILPPDDKYRAIQNMMSVGVSPQKAYDEVNKLKPLPKKYKPVLIEAIRKKIPVELFQDFEQFIAEIEAV